MTHNHKCMVCRGSGVVQLDYPPMCGKPIEGQTVRVWDGRELPFACIRDANHEGECVSTADIAKVIA